mmetsp:Transcript_18675/g.26305  ORF Transcript_18675/g.26305 Transcript_18675/m.26305 type:complete len:296 (-) Transcript_18675:419-1306(-)|eukprot:CAMPEP_0184862694 /NCGR_PEP_ID=MMETSP0580-20130426/7104_1 /TAXON_ID=1118495 /ORGANISM="Dactyliosolen fragilissimus" /LENGTH=295 /DNA_ID=CAMNT_0027360651 /DNA_START=87 /DNA_END=974 /DNA_ORIENTATION=+
MKGNSNENRHLRVLLGITGSVAAVKAPELAVLLSSCSDDQLVDVKVILTRGAKKFWNEAQNYDSRSWKSFCERLFTGTIDANESILNQEQDITVGYKKEQEIHKTCEGFQGLQESNGMNEYSHGTIQVYEAEDEWKNWNSLNDSVLHIDLRNWADIFVIAPISAHSLAKLSCGLCDDTLSCVFRAWDFGWSKHRRGKPVVIAPAMNTAMWEHPLTKSQLDKVKGFWNSKDNNACEDAFEKYVDKIKEDETNCGIYIVDPQVKKLACGEVGDGAMASIGDIVDITRKALSSLKSKA